MLNKKKSNYIKLDTQSMIRGENSNRFYETISGFTTTTKNVEENCV